MKELDDRYEKANRQAQEEDRRAEFQSLEDFCLQEPQSARDRRATARGLEASEETRLAVQVAQLKGWRLKSQSQSADGGENSGE